MEAARAADEHGDVVIADIDEDGFLLSRVGPIKHAPTTRAEEFRRRWRCDLQVVARDGVLAVRKHYRGNKLAFVRELAALHDLGTAGCHVPAVLDFDAEGLTLTASYVVGTVLREELAVHGANLRNRDRDWPPGAKGVERIKRNRIVVASRLVDDVVEAGFVDRLLEELRAAHRAGYVLHDVKYGNVIIERDSGDPYLIDFDAARSYPSLGSLAKRYLRDHDYEKFNLHLGRDALTHTRVRQLMKHGTEETAGHFYAPVYLEGGLRFGPIWNIDVGYSRWHYILERHLPPLSGARVLDLGANNGFNAINMLRQGARQAVAVEMDERNVRQSAFVQRLYEWADNASYDFTCLHEDMRNVPFLDLGRFDLVTAFCSIYYLDDDEILKLLRFLGGITDTVVLECNTDRKIERSDPHTFEKASVDYTLAALRDGGFPDVRVVAPQGYSRPLIIGRR